MCIRDRGEAVGLPQINFILLPTGIPTGEAFGSMIVVKPLLYIARYIIEARDSSGNLLAVLKNAYGISLEETVNKPASLTFLSPADDDKLSFFTRANEIWVRDVENNTVLEKIRMQYQEDTR